MRGRKPKPAAVHRLNGNPSHLRLEAYALDLPPEVPDMPEHLDGEARAEWLRASADLHARGVLVRTDRTALAMYCQAWSDWVAARKVITKVGQLIVKTRRVRVVQEDGSTAYNLEQTFSPNPALKIAARAHEQVMRLMVELGMTPSARMRVPPNAAGKPAEGSPTAKILNFIGGKKQAS